MNILYAGTISPGDSALYRSWALKRHGHTIFPVNTHDYNPKSALLAKIMFRAVYGPNIDRLNRDLLRIAETEKIDLLWGDKLLWIQPSTLNKLRSMGVVTVSYMIDNPFGPRKDPGWRLYMKNIPLWDLHCVQRDINVPQYFDRGARDVIKIQTSYEPTLQFPPPPGWSDADRDREVSFIGTPYDNRSSFLSQLHTEFGLPVAVNGSPLWKRELGPEVSAAVYRGTELYQHEYRIGMWKSKINISFVTHSNQDEFANKTFEIAGSGAFLLVERSEGHLKRFEEDVEAVFFSSVEECAEKCRRYLPDEEARTRIAAAGRARSERDGYSNDHQTSLILARAMTHMPAVREAAGRTP